MGLTFECNISWQNCAALYPAGTGSVPAGADFTNTSCVQDLRLSGSIGRCGWPGAPCSIFPDVENTPSNCAGGELVLLRVSQPSLTGLMPRYRRQGPLSQRCLRWVSILFNSKNMQAQSALHFLALLELFAEERAPYQMLAAVGYSSVHLYYCGLQSFTRWSRMCWRYG